MKILHVLHSIDPRTGGPGHVLRCLFREQAAAGHQVTLLTTTVQIAEPWQPEAAYQAAMAADPAFAGGELVMVEASGRRRPWSTYAHSPEAKSWLARRLSDPAATPDLVHIHGVFSHITTAAARMARRYGVPYLIRPAGILNSRCLAMGKRYAKTAFTRLFLRKDLQHAACLHVTSQQEADEVRRWVPAERICIVPHGVEIPPADLEPARRKFLETYPQLQGKQVVLFLGRIAAKKRPEILAEAVARLRSRWPELVLLLAGYDDGALAAVEAAVRNRDLSDAVLHVGFLQGEAKQGAFAVARLMALPSIDENFAIAVVEAMAHGVPVLLTEGVASHVYVDAAGGGLTVEGTVEAFADGIGRMLEGGAEEMGQRAREYAREHLSWSSTVRQLDTVYEQILAREVPA